MRRVAMTPAHFAVHGSAARVVTPAHFAVRESVDANCGMAPLVD
jgi:hypothetical protein